MIEFRLKIYGEKLHEDSELISEFTKAGFRVEIFGEGSLNGHARPIEKLGITEEVRNIYIIEMLESEKEVLDIVEKIRDYERNDVPILLVTKEESKETQIFAEVNRLKILGQEGNPERILQQLQDYIEEGVLAERNQRKNLRLNMTFPVLYSDGSYYHKVMAANISRDGIYLVTLNPLENSQVCRVIFSLPGQDRKCDYQARVLYNIRLQEGGKPTSYDDNKEIDQIASHPGMALFFVDVSEEEKDRISDYIISKLYN